MIKLILIFSFPIYIYSQQCQQGGVFIGKGFPCQAGEYEIVFEDNFDGNTLDLSIWELQPWGSGGLAEYNQLENVQVSNGTAKILAKNEFVEGKRYISYDADDFILDDGLPNKRDYFYTSSNIWSKEKFLHGKYEIRCRLPSGKGFWPAFWTYGGNRWNELDVFEIHENNFDQFTCNIHHDYDGDGKSEQCNFATETSYDFSDWHVFTCEFQEYMVSWYIDGNLMRTEYRYMTASGTPIHCDEEIGNGLVFEDQAYPRESMSIIFNLAVEKDEFAPDETTQFPSIFEIDYIRFYEKKEGCSGCLESMYYQNTEGLPTITRTRSYIEAGENTKVKVDQSVVFKAQNNIKLSPGFKVELGGYFKGKIKNCKVDNYEEVALNYIGNNAVEGYQIDKCTNPEYYINASGALYYSVSVYTLSGQLVGEQIGQVTSNYIFIHNFFSNVTGTYEVRQSLLNCSDSDYKVYNLYVYSSCQMNLVDNDDFNMIHQEVALEKTIKKQNIIDERQDPSSGKMSVYPIPTKDEVYILSQEKLNQVLLLNINNEILLQKSFDTTVGSINLSFYPAGVYYLKVVDSYEVKYFKILKI